MNRFACLVLLFFSLFAQAQNVQSPLDIPLLLSGNFGELRHNHFHAGIDFKTQGRTGLPVKSVKEGFISRISVSPYGYGRAVYINHPDGTTSVYGHLDDFASKVKVAVVDSQYQKESFAVNLLFTSEQFPLKQGEVFGYSGNTGSSGGPHVHFEFRETDTDKPIDPLPYFKNRIKDTRPPEIRGIMLFPLQGRGIVNGNSSNQPIALDKDKSGKQVIGTTINAWGRIGVGIKAYDRMNETTNIYGVNEIILTVDGEKMYHSVMDAFSFDDTRYLNTYIDWADWIENNSFYMKSFTDPGNRLGVNRAFSDGIIDINEERVYRLEYQLKDIYDNTTILTFNIEGKEDSIPRPPSSEVRFRYNRNNKYNEKGIDLAIPWKNLYTNLYFDVDTINGFSPFAPLYVIGERVPLHTYCPLILDITNDSYSDKSKYGVVHVYKKKRTWLGGEYAEGKISTKIRELGSFSVQIDTVPPVITPVNAAKWEANRRISFKITDNLSGIESYRGTLNGEFILFEYDAKTNSLFYIYDSERMTTGNKNLKLVVIDRAGNKAEYEKISL